MINLINYYRPFFSYDEKEEWYYKIIVLPEIKEVGCSFTIDNSNDGIYGQYSTEGIVSINLNNQPNLHQLAKTIAHEIAHIQEWKHDSNHKSLTSHINKYIKSQLSKKDIKVKMPKKVRKSSGRKYEGSSNKSNSSIDDIYNKVANW